MSKKLPLVFLDVSIDGDSAEKMVFELFSDVAPKTAENFRALYTGEKGISPKTGRPLHYKGSFFHSIVKGSMAQNGMHSLCPAVWSKHRRWLLMSMICLNPLMCGQCRRNARQEQIGQEGEILVLNNCVPFYLRELCCL